MLRLEATQGGNLKTLKKKMKPSTNVRISTEVKDFIKLGGKLE
jgi:hypothetical protein